MTHRFDLMGSLAMIRVPPQDAYYYGWSLLWMLPMMLLIWGAVIAVAIWGVRALTTSRNSGHAMDTLRRRLAAGEISQEDFEKTKRVLQG